MTGNSMRRFAAEDMVASFIFTGLALVTLWAAMQLTGVGRVFPIHVITVAVVLGIVDGILSFARFRAAARPGTSDEARDVQGRELAALAWPVALVVLIYVLGFIVAIPVFMAAFMLQRRNIRKKHIYTMAFVFTAVVYVLFDLVLGAGLHAGALWEWIS